MKRHGFKRPARLPRRPPHPPGPGLHRRLRHPVPGVQGHADGRPHGRREGHHPEPQVVQADAERDLVLVRGSVPGPKGGLVLIRDAVKAGALTWPPSTSRTPRGAKAGSVDLDEAMFGIEPNVPVMHQVVTAQLAARRAGTQSTKTRAEVRGGGAKPWKQKGTGRARAGSSRSPHLDRRWRDPRPEAPRLRPEHPQEDDPPGAALGPVRPGRRRASRSCSTGASTRRAPRAPSPPSPPRRRGPGARRAPPRGRRRLEEPAQPRPRPHLRRRRAQRLRRARRPTGSSSPPTRLPVDRPRHPWRPRPTEEAS